ncbi:hypothetical protein LS69_007780 [Helicobacter sp. MIT 05-5294]|nr:hypothetical protein LS69_007780 [Helicobacter sp. MIT 05-5294]
MSFTEKDLGTLLRMNKEGLISFSDEGSLEYTQQTKVSDSELQKENDKLRDTLDKLVKEYESLAAKFKEMAEAKDNQDNNAEIEFLKAENESLKKELENKESTSDSVSNEKYQELQAAYTLLENTATRLANENEELTKRLESQPQNTENVDSEKIAELEAKLETARKVFKQQKAEIETLKSTQGNVNVEEMREKIKAEANEKLKNQWLKLVAEKDKELENKVKELSGLREMEIKQKDDKIKELESKISTQAQSNLKDVPYGAVELMKKCLPMIENDLNPQQREIVKSKMLTMARDLTEVYENDYKEKKRKHSDKRQAKPSRAY